MNGKGVYLTSQLWSIGECRRPHPQGSVTALADMVLDLLSLFRLRACSLADVILITPIFREHLGGLRSSLFKSEKIMKREKIFIRGSRLVLTYKYFYIYYKYGIPRPVFHFLNTHCPPLTYCSVQCRRAKQCILPYEND